MIPLRPDGFNTNPQISLFKKPAEKIFPYSKYSSVKYFNNGIHNTDILLNQVIKNEALKMNKHLYPAFLHRGIKYSRKLHMMKTFVFCTNIPMWELEMLHM